ncbi:ACL103Wp [Eremothecium gossypii ATCC 10895]|uniref:Mitochondrial translation factor ATP22 n=1 Tax=Eremothecium gossypii (strain ATCC 10895 / CBS 109.51 / FGSC 9923 / NRRL Y-1056) TaxID=284811 RepID=ATP22_EREGS|nr:ACL103Wp [Eremothecium gossypii ATCC 10895]Q75CM2.1 RecName: Full=Mitochondrial translation factor ATP22; Flags: Precursor [Eremothecium gossypii ATCC 10895]AAS51125.1 ACL103Wp [Eremothecium gossypii ATCC 10895]
MRRAGFQASSLLGRICSSGLNCKKLTVAFSSNEHMAMSSWAGDLGRRIGTQLYRRENVAELRRLQAELQQQWTAAGDGRARAELEACARDEEERAFFRLLMPASGPEVTQRLEEAVKEVLGGRSSRAEKRERLYCAIALVARENAGRGIEVPEAAHRWFAADLGRNEYFGHMQFLIEHGVQLNAPAAFQLVRTMLRSGSELEVQLVSFKLFLYDTESRRVFEEKFDRVYDFMRMHYVITQMVVRRDFRFMRDYLEVLARRLEQHELCDARMSAAVQRDHIARYTELLMLYARKSGDEKMLAELFASLVDSLPRGMGGATLRQPLHEVMTYLISENQPQQVLKLVAGMRKAEPNRRPGKSSVPGTLALVVSALRQFNNPNLVVSFIVQAYRKTQTRVLLGQLGLWSLAFYGRAVALSPEAAKSPQELAQISPVDLPKELILKSVPDSCIMCELYQAILSEKRSQVPAEEYREILIQLFALYQDFMGKLVHKYDYYHLYDTSVLRLLLYKIKNEVGDGELAFKLLMDFYGQPKMRPKCTAEGNPFGVVLYQNNAITQTQLNQALALMGGLRIPMDFKTTSSMVLWYASAGDIDLAHTWYTKLVRGRFQMKNRRVLKLALAHGWTIPAYADQQLVSELSRADNSSDGPEHTQEAVETAVLESEEASACTSIIIEKADELLHKIQQTRPLDPPSDTRSAAP